MEKTGINNIICVKCSEQAVRGTDPPVCTEHMQELEKTATDEPVSLRELADNPGDVFDV